MAANKLQEGKRLNIVISALANEALQQHIQQTQKKTTRIIEELLETLPHSRGEKVLSQAAALIQMNEKLYQDTNATLSNLNQIAHHLNLAELLDFKNHILNQEFLEKNLLALKRNAQLLQDLRILILQLQILLEKNFGKISRVHSIEKKYTRYLKKIVQQEGFKRGLLQDFLQEQSDRDIQRFLKAME